MTVWIKQVDELELFLQELEGVEPLKQDKVDIEAPADKTDFAYRREAAVIEKNPLNPLADAIEIVDKNALISFKRSGVQEGVFKKLRLGKYESQARLDLHNMTVDKARHEVLQFIKDCMRYDLRVATIVHGKGTRSEGGVALLKSHCVHWLEQIEEVMAFHSTQAQHGGTGALYVLLRKSDEARQRNRELHGGRYG